MLQLVDVEWDDWVIVGKIAINTLLPYWAILGAWLSPHPALTIEAHVNVAFYLHPIGLN